MNVTVGSQRLRILFPGRGTALAQSVDSSNAQRRCFKNRLARGVPHLSIAQLHCGCLSGPT